MLRALAFGLALLASPVLAQDNLRAAAEAGQVEAQFQLAERYNSGNGVLQSYARAAIWYQKAAEQGDPRAMHGLAKILFSGIGLEPDPVLALQLMSKAAETGDPEVLLDLGSALELGAAGEPDPTSAAKAYQAAAEAGSDAAAVALGLLVQSGTGVEQDIPRAVQLYTGPAERGNAKAQNNLGLIYARGIGVAQDYAAARMWFERASANGLPEAMRNLAALYANGFGVDFDEERANVLLRAAAAGGAGSYSFFGDPRLAAPNAELLQNYAFAASKGDPVASFNFAMLVAASEEAGGAEYAEASRAFHRAARKGLPAAMANLGLMMFEGRGVLQDFVEGYAWLTVAGSLGLTDALELRDRFAGALTTAQLNAAQTRAEVIWQEVTGSPPQ